jgi:hypothetical protein
MKCVLDDAEEGDDQLHCNWRQCTIEKDSREVKGE